MLSWKLFYWFLLFSILLFRCYFVNLMLSCTVAAFLPYSQCYWFILISWLFKQKVFQNLVVLIIFSWTSFQFNDLSGRGGRHTVSLSLVTEQEQIHITKRNCKHMIADLTISTGNHIKMSLSDPRSKLFIEYIFSL